MAIGSSSPLDSAAQATVIRGVYLVPTSALNPDDRVYFIDGRPVTAIAPHPTLADMLYMTTEHPDLLSFLPDGYVEVF